jgi:hypothetical protein
LSNHSHKSARVTFKLGAVGFTLESSIKPHISLKFTLVVVAVMSEVLLVYMLHRISPVQELGYFRFLLGAESIHHVTQVLVAQMFTLLFSHNSELLSRCR